jgi:hypothetical protein
MKKMAAIVIAVGMLASAPRGSLAASVTEFSWQGPVAAGRTLDVRGLNGAIHATRAPGREAIVRATKQSRKGDPDRVRIETWTTGGDVHFCAVHPGQKRKGANPCELKSVKNVSRDDDDVTVTWEVQVPSGVRFVATTVNGDVEIEEIGGPIEAHTVNGSIDLATDDVAEAATVNGGITARLGAGRLAHDLDFRTVNGSVVVSIADGVGAELRAEALNGDFASDFPITIEGRRRRNVLHGTIGGGGALLSLATVNGSIELRRHSSASK